MTLRRLSEGTVSGRPYRSAHRPGGRNPDHSKPRRGALLRRSRGRPSRISGPAPPALGVSGQIQTWETLALPHPWQPLTKLLMDPGRIVPIRSFEESCLSLRTTSRGRLVPPIVAETIRSKRPFRPYQSRGSADTWRRSLERARPLLWPRTRVGARCAMSSGGCTATLGRCAARENRLSTRAWI